MSDRGPVFGIRRVPELDPAPPPESDPDLVARIRAEILERGPMTFARFMELALYDPTAGYYAAGDRGPGGERGDFLTAPESHPIFGWAIARQLEETWERLGRPGRFVVREHGAGRGALAAAILDGLRRRDAPLLKAVAYQAIDVAPARLAALAERLAAVGLGDRLEPADGLPGPGAVVANELLDALPVHRVVGTPGGGLEEIYVALGADDGFAAARGEPSTPALAARLASEGIVLEPGQEAEVCLLVDDWIARAAAPLECGLMLLIDYGYPARELYAPTRDSTLRAYARHRVHADPFRSVGRQDLTAHVDLTAVEAAAARAGLELLGRTTQAELLTSLGAGELLVELQSGPEATLPDYLAARSALIRMIDPAAMGRFAVLLFGRALPPDPPPIGLTFRMPVRRTRAS